MSEEVKNIIIKLSFIKNKLNSISKKISESGECSITEIEEFLQYIAEARKVYDENKIVLETAGLYDSNIEILNKWNSIMERMKEFYKPTDNINCN